MRQVSDPAAEDVTVESRGAARQKARNVSGVSLIFAAGSTGAVPALRTDGDNFIGGEKQ